MVIKCLLGRELDVEIETDSDEGCYFASATYVDDGSPLSDAALDELTEAYPELLEEIYFERQIITSESYADMQEDR